MNAYADELLYMTVLLNEWFCFVKVRLIVSYFSLLSNMIVDRPSICCTSIISMPYFVAKRHLEKQQKILLLASY